MLERLLMDNEPQFVRKFFDATCAAFETKLMTSTAYRSQTSGQTEQYYKTIVSLLYPYIRERQDDLNTSIQTLTYSITH